LLKLENISKIFNRGLPAEVKALQPLSLEIPHSEFVVVVGSNGSGKSTLMNLIAGTFRSDTGNIFIENKNVTSQHDYSRSKFIARIFQNPLAGTAPDLSILDNFRLASLRTQRKRLSIGVNKDFRKRVQEQITSMNLSLENKLDQPMGTLSGGQRQALTLLMAVMDDCKILLLDEPTAALDPRTSELVMQTAEKIIKQFDLTTVFITHDMKYAQRYGNRIIHLSEGKVVHDLNADEKAKLQVTDLYNWFA
jgi:putative tryptophan/tyrosine transport system ATP-binding protein